MEIIRTVLNFSSYFGTICMSPNKDQNIKNYHLITDNKISLAIMAAILQPRSITSPIAAVQRAFQWAVHDRNVT